MRLTTGSLTVQNGTQLEYAEIYKTLASTLPKKIVQLSNTRWLVRLQAIDTILEQWDALKLHFQITESNKERCYTAYQLYGMYCTPENKLFLTFLSNSLKGVMAVNRLFQSESISESISNETVSRCE